MTCGLQRSLVNETMIALWYSRMTLILPRRFKTTDSNPIMTHEHLSSISVLTTSHVA